MMQMEKENVTLFIAFAVLWHDQADWYWWIAAVLLWMSHLAYHQS